MPSILTYTFVCLLALTSVIRIWLGRRHIAYVQHHRNEVPVAFNANIALDAHQKAADYAAVKTK
ncbi:MAG: M48 family peptidase, partial [Methylophilales bacterium]|nr:M48 family peptidase [Methylophilales bacterium]